MKKCLLAAVPLSLSGYGIHSRQIFHALSKKFDIATQIRRWGECAFISDDTEEKKEIIDCAKKLAQWQQANTQPDFSVQVTVPNEFEKMAPLNIGITAGIEVDRVKPDWLVRCNEKLNLLITPSTFAADGFAKTIYQTQQGQMLRLNVPIEVIPESVNTSIFNNEKTEDLNIPLTTTFNFLTVGQWGIGDMDRKNILTLIKTFKETFRDHRDKEKIGLILRINSISGSLIDEDYTLKKLHSILREYQEFPKVYLIHGQLSDSELARLYKDSRIKVFVTLSHGEGYGLPLIEAASCDLPIIAPNFSGYLDFLNLGKWIKIPVELKEIPFQNDLFQQGSKWAFPDLSEVKRHFLKIYDNLPIPKRWAQDLGVKIRETLNVDVVEQKYFDVLKKYNFLSDEQIEQKTIADSIFADTNLEEVVK